MKEAHRQNSFDFLRFLAAGMVIFAHSFETTGHLFSEPLHLITQKMFSLGAVAVWVFFMISGYLVTGSWLRNSDWKAFLVSRLLRIYPLLFVVVITSMLLGALITTDPNYFQNPLTYNHLQYLGLHLPGGESIPLPGVFENQPKPGIVNGSLWTLQYEFTLYLLLLLLGQFRLFTRESALALTLGLILIHWRLSGTLPQPWIYLSAFFMVGASVRLWEERLKFHSTWAWLSVLGFTAMMCLNEVLFAVLIFGWYPLFTVARSHLFAFWSKGGDASYGMYVWGYPVQQLLVHLQTGLSWQQNFIQACLITVPLAYLCWHLIENPALKLKSHLLPSKKTQDPPSLEVR